MMGHRWHNNIHCNKQGDHEGECGGMTATHTPRPIMQKPTFIPTTFPSYFHMPQASFYHGQTPIYSQFAPPAQTPPAHSLLSTHHVEWHAIHAPPTNQRIIEVYLLLLLPSSAQGLGKPIIFSAFSCLPYSLFSQYICTLFSTVGPWAFIVKRSALFSFPGTCSIQSKPSSFHSFRKCCLIYILFDHQYSNH